MKTISKLGMVAVLFATAIFSCKQGEASAEDAAFEAVDSASVTLNDVVSSSAAVEPKKSNRKFIRTADIKFQVNDVPKATYAIESATSKFGGFVTYTNLESKILEKEETKISQDSTMETTKYRVENSIIIRVPNTKLDTLLTSIRKQIDFLDSRLIKADDVSLQLLANKMSQKRNSIHSNRLEKAIDNKGKKLKDIANSEDDLEVKNEEKDNHEIENLSLKIK